MRIALSNFQDNFSLGRASLFFAEEENAKVMISLSNFTHNYAMNGGVFFSQLNGFI
jgi:hypothetical protein